MLYFSSRSKARNFSNAKRKFVDNGANAPKGKRWAVKVLGV